MSVDTAFAPTNLDAPYIAAESFAKAYEVAEKKYEKVEYRGSWQEVSAPSLDCLPHTGIEIHIYLFCPYYPVSSLPLLTCPVCR